jgi:hypothetical protein
MKDIRNRVNKREFIHLDLIRKINSGFRYCYLTDECGEYGSGNGEEYGSWNGFGNGDGEGNGPMKKVGIIKTGNIR